MNTNDNACTPRLGSFRAATGAALLGVALAPAIAQAAQPKLSIALDSETVAEGDRSLVSLKSDRALTSAAALGCSAIVTLTADTAEEGDYQIVGGNDTIRFYAGEKAFGDVEVDALQDDDADHETVTVSVEVECAVNPPPANESPIEPADVTLTIKDDDPPQFGAH